MVVYCRVKTCNHTSKDKCTMHRFSKDQKEISKEWVRLSGNENLLHIKSLRDLNNERMCRCHFTSENYDPKNKLKSGSVPTIFFENTKPIDKEKMEKYFLTGNYPSTTRKILATIATIRPLGDISNVKAITHKQPKMTKIIQSVDEIEQPLGHIEQVTAVEDRELTACPVIENENQTSQRIIHQKRKISELESKTSEESTGTSVSKKRYRLSVATKYTTVKKVVETELGKNVIITPEIERLARVLIQERADRKQLELQLRLGQDKYEKLLQQLKSNESVYNVGNSCKGVVEIKQ